MSLSLLRMHASHAVVANDDVTGSHPAVRLASGPLLAIGPHCFLVVDCYRFGRTCVYERRPVQISRGAMNHVPGPAPAPHNPLIVEDPHEAHLLEPVMTLLVGDQIPDIDGSTEYSLSKKAIDRTVRLQVSRMIGNNLEAIRDVATLFFDTIHVKISFLSKERFLYRLNGGLDDAPADFTALCLCISLVLQHPHPGVQTMQSPRYVIVKNIITLLESTGCYLTLEHIQCRLLVIYYELGHDISPGVSVSLGACARMARALGLNRNWHRPISNELGSAVAEEERRAWWTIFILDR